jgi:hypothetical protein
LKLFSGAALAGTLQLALLLPAHAQWQGSVGLGERHVIHTEYDKAGSTLVRETGWLPGLVLGAGYRAGPISWFTEGEMYRRDIAYRGQTQAGAPAESTTSTSLALVRVGGAHAFGSGYAAVAGLEWQQWRRDILGTAQAAGLQERYRSTRLVAGARKTWQPAAGAVSVDAAVVLGLGERLHVGFSGLLDPASLEMKRSQGIRIGVSMRPVTLPRIELHGGFDWTTIARSDDAPVSRGGSFIGIIAQPELNKRAMTFTIKYIFGCRKTSCAAPR